MRGSLRLSRSVATLVVVLLSFAASTSTGQPAPHKKPITHDVYDGWRTIQGTKVSRDGVWVAYALVPQDGDGELVVRNLKTNAEYRAPRGRDPVITPDQKFVVFAKAPLKSDVDKARKAKKKPEDMPKAGVGVIDLASGEVTTLAEHVKSFKLPEEPTRFVAFLSAPEGRDGQEKREGREGQEAETRAKTKKHEPGTDLVIHDLAARTDQKIPEVAEYAVAKDGSALAYAVSSRTPASDGAFVRKMSDGSAKALLTGQGDYKGFAFDGKASQLAFISDRDDYAAKASRFKLYHAQIGATAASELTVPSESRAGPITVSENGRLEFSKDGGRLFFGTAAPPHAEPDDAPEPVKVDIWNYKDPELQPMQKVRAEEEKKRSFRAEIDLADKRFTQLASPDMPDLRTNDSGVRALGISDVPYRQLSSWDGNYDDVFLVKLADGSRQQIVEKGRFPASMSPGGSYVLYFSEHDDNWYAVRTSDGQKTNLTSKLGVKFQSETDDHPDYASPYGQAGWTEGDKSVLLYDRYDIWEVKPDGSGGRMITGGLGRKNQIVFRYSRTEAAPPSTEEEAGGRQRQADEPVVSSTKPMILSAVDDRTKASGLYRVTLNSTVEPVKLAMLDKSFGVPIKARDADVYVFTMSRFEEFPNLWASSGSFTDMKKISDANPQQAEYNWGTSELIDYVNADGKHLNAILTKPEDFDPSKKYPLIVYIYEQLTNNLHHYVRAGARRLEHQRHAIREQRLHRAAARHRVRHRLSGTERAEVRAAGDAESHLHGLRRSGSRRHPGAQLGRLSDLVHDHADQHLPRRRSGRVRRRHVRRLRRHSLGHRDVAGVPVRKDPEPHRRAALAEPGALHGKLAALLDREDPHAVPDDGER